MMTATMNTCGAKDTYINKDWPKQATESPVYNALQQLSKLAHQTADNVSRLEDRLSRISVRLPKADNADYTISPDVKSDVEGLIEEIYLTVKSIDRRTTEMHEALRV